MGGLSLAKRLLAESILSRAEGLRVTRFGNFRRPWCRWQPAWEIPAKAGIHSPSQLREFLDTGLRRCDGLRFPYFSVGYWYTTQLTSYWTAAAKWG